MDLSGLSALALTVLAACTAVLGWRLRRTRSVLRRAEERVAALTCDLDAERDRRQASEEAAAANAARTARLLDRSRDFNAVTGEAHVLEALVRDAHDLLEPRATVVWTAGPTAEPIFGFNVGRADSGRVPWHVVRSLRSGHSTREERRDDTLDLAVPLWAGGSCTGVLDVRGLPADRAVLIDDLELLVAHAATAVNAARLKLTSADAALRDALTGAANGRRLDEDLATEVSLARRAGAPLAYLHLAVDGFAAYNDRHGHRAGDDALLDVAAVVRAVSRGSDTLYRIDGPTFAVLLRAGDDEAGARLGERVRAAVSAQLARRGLTLSVGVAALPAHASAADELTSAAAAAAAEAGRQGGDRVVVAPPASGGAEVVQLPQRG